MAHCYHNRVRQSCSICNPEQVYKSYQRKAKERGLGFELTLQEFERIVSQPCVFCGEQVDPRGLDRRDSNIGYFIWNVQACCWPCNKMKSALTQFVFLQQVRKIADYQAKQRMTLAA